ncbi:outer membrane beta-barrel protein [Kaarinaea lacus]
MGLRQVRGSIVLLVMLFASINSNAFAANYLGAGFGTASWDIKPLLGTYDVDDGSPIRLFFGTRKGNLGMEMEFSMSEHDWVDSFGIVTFPGDTVTHLADHLIFSGVGYLPLNQTFDLYGKIGLNIWSTEVELQGLTLEGDDGIDFALGAGFNINATQHFLIRLEAQYLPGIGDGLDEGDITQFTANAAYAW